MKAIVVEKPNVVRLLDLPVPEPPPGWVLVRVRAAAICMTDFEVIHGRIPSACPLTPGHEWSGVVEGAGAPEDRRWIGRRVTGDNEITCLKCVYCRRGEWRRCPVYRQIGFEAPGAYAEYFTIPVHNLHELPESVSFEQGALIEPLGVGLAVAAMAGARIGTTAAVLGAGPIGLNCLVALRASGARRILCLDLRPQRLELARRWGAFATFTDPALLEQAAREYHPHGTDVVVDASGSPDLLRPGIRLTRFGGTFLLAGFFGGRDAALLPDEIHERNVRLLGAGNNAGFNQAALLAAGDGLLRTEAMITHRFRLDDFEHALSAGSVQSPDYIKGVFLPGS